MLGWLGAIGLLAATMYGAVMWHLLRDGYMLLLAMSALCLLLAREQRQRLGAWRSWRALGWLRSWGRLSYEICLTHMFVVVPVVALFHFGGSHYRLGVLWYVLTLTLTLPLCWLLGVAVERWFSLPCERWLPTWMLRTPMAVEPHPAMKIMVD